MCCLRWHRIPVRQRDLNEARFQRAMGWLELELATGANPVALAPRFSLLYTVCDQAELEGPSFHDCARQDYFWILARRGPHQPEHTNRVQVSAFSYG